MDMTYAILGNLTVGQTFKMSPTHYSPTYKVCDMGEYNDPCKRGDSAYVNLYLQNLTTRRYAWHHMMAKNTAVYLVEIVGAVPPAAGQH